MYERVDRSFRPILLDTHHLVPEKRRSIGEALRLTANNDEFDLVNARNGWSIHLFDSACACIALRCRFTSFS